MYPPPGPYSPFPGSPQGPVPPLPGPRPAAMFHVRTVQFVAAGIVLLQGILGIVMSTNRMDNGPYLSTAATGTVISMTIQIGLIITVAIQSFNGVNAWRVVGTICAGFTVLSALTSLTGISRFPFFIQRSTETGYAITDMILSGLLAAAAITALVLWWTRQVNDWYAGWDRVRRYASALGVPTPPIP